MRQVVDGVWSSTSQSTSAVPSSHGIAAQRRQVGLHDEIAIALLPACRLVAGHRLHIDVVGEQIVAAMRLVVRGCDEILGLEALADQPALHVDERGDDGVDLARGDGLLQLVEGQIPGHACHALDSA